MRKVIIRYGLLIVAVGLLLQLSRYMMVPFLDRKELQFTGYALAGVLLVIFLLRYRSERLTGDDVKPDEIIKELGISLRELEVLREMAGGRSNKEIAERLFIAETTVKTHVSSIFSKLHAKRRTEAISKAREYHLID